MIFSIINWSFFDQFNIIYFFKVEDDTLKIGHFMILYAKIENDLF